MTYKRTPITKILNRKIKAIAREPNGCLHIQLSGGETLQIYDYNFYDKDGLFYDTSMIEDTPK